MKPNVFLVMLLLLTACAPTINMGSSDQPLRGSSGYTQASLGAIPYAEVTSQTSPDTFVRLSGCPDASFRLGDVQALGENGPDLACQRVQQVRTGSNIAVGAVVLAGVATVGYFIYALFHSIAHQQ